jgi:hypothetical protein
LGFPSKNDGLITLDFGSALASHSSDAPLACGCSATYSRASSRAVFLNDTCCYFVENLIACASCHCSFFAGVLSENIRHFRKHTHAEFWGAVNL